VNTAFPENLDSYLEMKRYRLVRSVLVYEKGQLAYERYFGKGGIHQRHPIKSVWKSILSLTLGICLDKGWIKDIDEPVSRFLPSFSRRSHPYHAALTIRHLVTMSSGIYWNSGTHYHAPMLDQMRRSNDWAAHIADVRVANCPGTRFTYNEWDVILLSALIGKVCGGSAWDVCRERLYNPLGIDSHPWTQSNCGIAYPSYGPDTTDALSARDMAKIGLLMLNNGLWDRQQVVSGGYIMRSVCPSPMNAGYGWLWWLSEKGYHARGFGGQELNVYPDHNIVAVIQADITPSGKSYNDICENII
jgi:CubicO group peptidase (beta-lactamase class C family)